MVPKNTGGQLDGCHVRSRLTESLKLHDICLSSDLLNKRPLGLWSTYGRFRSRTIKHSPDSLSSTTLHDKEDTGENDPKQQTNNKVPYGHANGNGTNGDVFRSIYSVTGIPYRLHCQVESEYKDQSADDHDRWDISLVMTQKGEVCNSRRKLMTFGPTIKTAVVAAASMSPESREPPPTL
jgi:hypothetical protein